jgi:hypothetical protein
MSTGYDHIRNTPITFKAIDREVKKLDVNAFTSEGAVSTPAGDAQRLSTVFASVRPILLSLAAVPLIPAAWRTALRVFVNTLDQVTAAFKAGKDLAVGPVDGSANVEMEPKLPVG